jgi:hypothetical protein
MLKDKNPSRECAGKMETQHVAEGHSCHVSFIYQSVHNYVDIADKILPSLPLPKGGIPLFGKEG